MSELSVSIRTISPMKYKWGVLALLVLVIAQQIYYPQQHSFFHLALLFVFMAIHDVRRFEFRDIRVEGPFLGAILLSSAISVFESVLALKLGGLYFLTITTAGLSLTLYNYQLTQILQSKQTQALGTNHQNIFEKSTRFFEGILWVISAIIAIAVGYLMLILIAN